MRLGGAMLKSSAALSEGWALGWKLKDRRPIAEWAAENVRLQPPITKVGKFDCSESRHFLDIFASCQNEHRRETNVLKPVRGGGSLIGDVRAPHAIATDPGPYMDIFQTDKVAGEHAETRIVPVFENCDPIKALLPIERSKKRNTEILFSNGCAWYCCGPSLGNLQTKGIRYLRLEEVWMWDQGRMGDALGRLGDYLRQQISHALTISQGGPKQGVEMQESDWYRHYHRGQIFEWEVTCPGCQKYFDPVFTGTRPDGTFWGVTWNRYTQPNGDWDIAKCLPTIRFECPHCSHPILDSGRTKSEWNRTGRWRLTTEPNQKRDSFHWEAVIDYPWDELVELWLDACNAERRGDLMPKLQFYQKRRAMFMDEQGLLKSGLNLTKSVYEIESPGELGRCMQVDRQEEDLFWYEVRAWFEGECRQLEFGKCYGFAAVEAIRERMKVSPNHLFIDSRYMPKGDNGVYLACVRYGWIAVRGSKEPHFIHRVSKDKRVLKSYAPLVWADPESGTENQGRKRCPVIQFSKYQMNQKVDELVTSGRWKQQMNPADPEMAKEYSAQMAGRIRKVEHNVRTGETNVFYFETKNDHARDLANFGCVYAILNDFIPDPATERLTKSEAARVSAP
jgi:hypothetical protein